MSKFDCKKFRVAVCSLGPNDIPVQSGLSFSPSQMHQMTLDGMPVSVQNAIGYTYDNGTRTLDFEPHLEYRRGVEFPEIWEATMDARKKIHGKMKEAIMSQQKEGV